MSRGAWNSRWMLLAIAGVVAGGLAAWFAPSGWLFVHEKHDEASAEDDGTRYVCPMFCVVLEGMPDNEECPVCGMTLEPWVAGGSLDTAAQWMVGLEAEALAKRALEREIRQIGEVDYDETRIATVTSRLSGFLEVVYENETWKYVAEGDLLAEIYSPELYAAQGEYLVAYERAGRPETLADIEDARQRSSLRATEARLRNLGIDEAEIAAIREAGEAQRTLALRAPRDGVLIRRNITEDSSVRVGDELYVIADLSRVWILVEVFESELPWVAIGQPVDIVTETLPGQVIRGEVAFVDPVFDRVRRTARVRVAVDNPRSVDTARRLFQPGQRVDARIRARLGADGRMVSPAELSDTTGPKVLSIPKDAVLRTGTRSVTFVLRDDADGGVGYDLDARAIPESVGYELVEIRVGPLAREAGSDRSTRYYPLLGVVAPPETAPGAGEEPEAIGLRRLRAGHVVVSKGNFLLDSQAQLAGKPSLLFPRGSGKAAGDSLDPHAGH